MNCGVRSVLIWGQACRTLLVDKGKPLSGDKGHAHRRARSKYTIEENGTRMKKRIRVQIW